VTTQAAIEIRTILFPTDFSPHAQHAFAAALALARHFGAHLHLLHVVHRVGEREAARRQLLAIAGDVASGQYTTAVEAGGAAEQIVRYAEQVKAELIVMGSHGRTGLSHVVRGSVAEAVVRHGPCLVVTLRGSVEAPVTVCEPPRGEPTAPSPSAASHCLVCARPSQERICEACRDRIQAEAIYFKFKDHGQSGP
jgi:universal stress protein A